MIAPIGRLALTSTILLALAGCAGADYYQKPAVSPAPPKTATVVSTKADGSWRVGVDVSSFFDGHIGRIDDSVDVTGGSFKSGFRDNSLEVAMTVRLTENWAKGLMAVDAGPQWNDTSIPFEGPVVDGVLQLDLTGYATYELFGTFHRRDVDARTLYVKLRLEKQPAS